MFRAVIACICLAASADEFETRIRPILASRCHGCHNETLKTGDLDLTGPAGAQRAATRMEEVLSWTGRVKMPPTGKLPAGEARVLLEWARAGAVWPKTMAGRASADHWAFQPVRRLEPPAVRNRVWVRNPIDQFILARLEIAGISPAPPADRLTWFRRVTYDLTGLPPSEIEVRALHEDERTVIERLLASPRYGEHWGRHWMDVARYADSTGADEDHRYPYAWRYRDYIIDAFQRDLPYDQFVREQIAGDLLPSGDGGSVNKPGIVATGFLALGPKLIAEQDKKKMFYDIVDEQIDVVGKAFLGLTLACARCHDHKFDPITTRDYYSLAGIFASTKQLAKLEGTVSKLYFAPLVEPEVAAAWEKHQEKIETKQKEIDSVTAKEAGRYRDRLAPYVAAYILAAIGAGPLESLETDVVDRWKEYLKPTRERRAHLERLLHTKRDELRSVAREYQAEYEATAKERSENKEKKFFPGDNRFFTEVNAGPFALPKKNPDRFFTQESREKLKQLHAEMKSLKESGPAEPPLACGVSEGEIVKQHVFVRGNVEALGEETPKRFPVVLAGEQQTAVLRGSGRGELAEWIASEKNPLTARVIVNRVWQWHFGEGLVRTPSNFGKLGELPTHPELLDWLASEFVRGGWSIKELHRVILDSNTYRMSSLGSANDPENRLWSRFNRRRLAVEEIRDSLLAITGSLETMTGATLQKGAGTDKEFSDDRKSMDPDQSSLRTVYLPLRRSNLPGLLNLFDFGDATTSGEGRTQTNVAPQALYFMNSRFVEQQAQRLVEELQDHALETAYLRILGRPATAAEITEARVFLERYPGDRAKARAGFFRALMGSNEFLYVH